MPSTRPLALRIPDDIGFASLNLSRDPQTGAVAFDWEPIAAICRANGVDEALFRAAPEDNVAGLITAWYAQHLASGGAHDATADDLIAEAQAEDERGGGLSHQPGRA